MDTKVDREVLQQRWLHSHEEDTGEEMVYRPTTFAFPRSRGRTGFDLKPDNRLVEIGTAPTDGPREQAGTWELGEDGELTLTLKPAASSARSLRITSADKDRLVVTE